MMRIITGSARGTHLYTRPGDETRPTSERAKEALFSMLQQKPNGARVLDLFAGSGQLGLEALSRGAVLAVFVDGSKEASDIVRRNAERTHLLPKSKIVTGDALSYLRTCHEAPFDLCFLDPPYGAGILPECLSLLISRGLIAKDGLVITETRESADVFCSQTALADKFEIIKQNRYGVACITVMKEANI